MRALKNIAYFDYHRFLDNKKTLVTGFIQSVASVFLFNLNFKVGSIRLF